MTMIAVFSDSRSTQLIADSLITEIIGKDMLRPSGHWLSTGVYFDGKELLRCRYTEGVLKVWAIQANLAIGFAGHVWLATTCLELVVNQSRIRPFATFSALVEFMRQSVLPSISPFHGSCDLCGFVGENGITTKFVFSISDKNRMKTTSSSNPRDLYTVGSGSSEFTEIFSRVPGDQLFGGYDPTVIFSVFAEHLYMRQFLGRRELITEKYTGGAISGVYYSDGEIKWQPSRSLVTFANLGGTGFDARFEWLPILYKTWHERGSVFSSSLFEQQGNLFQRITRYSNLLSEIWPINENTLTKEMTTFNASRLNVILLPKGLSEEYAAVIGASGKLTAFDETLKNGRITDLRLNRDFFKRLSNEFFVAEDYTVHIGVQRFPSLIKALRKQLDTVDKRKDPVRWVGKQGELAVRLMSYGGRTKNLDLLSEALCRFLDAYETSREQGLSQIEGARHNVKQFLNDTNTALAQADVSIILERNHDAYQKFVDAEVK